MSAFARLYDLVMTTVDRIGFAGRRRAFARDARGRVLEIGAGTGLQFAHYARDAEVYAIEPDARMLDRARRRQRRAAGTIVLIVADARALPFRDRAFDASVVSLAFCTISEPRVAMRELGRALRPGGRAYLLEHVRSSRHALAAVQEFLAPAWARVSGGCQLARSTVDSLRETGFLVEVRRASFGDALVELVVQRPPSATDRVAERHDRTG